MKLFAAPVVTAAGPRQGRGVALFRPADTRLDANLSAPGLPVTVVEVSGRGALRALECRAGGGWRFTVEATEDLAAAFAPGQPVRLTARRVVIETPNAGRPDLDSTERVAPIGLF